MNKFMAMLKDSFREAVDGWIFPVMLGLAGIIILLVASSSVRPLAADVAVPRMIGGDGQGIQVRQDRGHGTKPAIFFVKLEVSAVVSSNSGSEPWAGPLTFNVTFKKTQQGRLVPAGVIFELGEDRIPKDSASLGELLIFGDPFKEAVRYWAGKTGEEKPKFTEELAKEFVAAMLADMGRMNGATATRQAPGGGLIEAAFGSADSTFAISVPGVDRVAWAHLPSLFFGLVPLDFPSFRQPLGQLIYTLESTLLNGIGAWVLLLTGVIVTAGFIPNMLRKGAIDIMLTKPVSRPLILFYKYLGGLLFVLLITALTVGGVWVAVGLRTGVWAPGILLSIGGITFYFAILYACSTLVGVLTRNAIVSIMLTIVFWFVVWLIGIIYAGLNVWDSVNVLQTAMQAQRQADKGGDKKQADKKDVKEEEPVAAPIAEPEAKIPKWLIGTFKGANRITPRTSDLDTLTSGLIAKGLLSPADEVRRESRGINWAEVLGVASAWIAFFLGLATLRFVTRSY